MTTCAEFAASWPETYPRPDEATNASHRYMIQRFVERFGRKPLAGVTRTAARRWATEYPGHVRYARTLYADALSDGLVETNPFVGLGRRSGGRKDLVVPTAEVIEALCSAAPAPLDTMIRFAAYTGLRLGESLALEASDIEGDLVNVTKQISGGRLKPPKGGHARCVLIRPEAGEVAAKGVCGRLWPYARTTHWDRWNETREAVGQDGLDWHCLRHFAATWFVDMGAHSEDVAIQLGHRDGGELVRRLYAHPDPMLALDRLQALRA